MIIDDTAVGVVREVAAGGADVIVVHALRLDVTAVVIGVEDAAVRE